MRGGMALTGPSVAGVRRVGEVSIQTGPASAWGMDAHLDLGARTEWAPGLSPDAGQVSPAFAGILSP